MLSRVHWVRPEMVVEVSYVEWTPDGLLRHVVYLGEREETGERCDPIATDLMPRLAASSAPPERRAPLPRGARSVIKREQSMGGSEYSGTDKRRSCAATGPDRDHSP